MLRNSETWETDKIMSQLIISMDGNTISVQTTNSEVHIEDSESGLKIYVPEQEVARDGCYLSTLPTRLTEWLMTDPVTLIRNNINHGMDAVTQAILNAKPSVFERILDHHGIIEAGPVNRDPEEEAQQTSISTPQRPTPLGRERSSSSSSTTRVMTPTTSTSRRHSNSDSDSDDETPEYPTPVTDLTEFHSRSAPHKPYDSYPLYSDRDSGSPDMSRGFYDQQRRSAANLYRDLLSHAVVAARRNETLGGSAFNLAGLADALPELSAAAAAATGDQVFDESSLFGTGSYTQVARDKMVGAAGELFVSFFLSHHTPNL